MKTETKGPQYTGQVPSNWGNADAIEPDVVTRIIEILKSAIDVEHRITSRITHIVDRMVGPNEVKDQPGQAIETSPTIALLLAGLEHEQSCTQAQLDRLQSTKL